MNYDRNHASRAGWWYWTFSIHAYGSVIYESAWRVVGFGVPTPGGKGFQSTTSFDMYKTNTNCYELGVQFKPISQHIFAWILVWCRQPTWTAHEKRISISHSCRFAWMKTLLDASGATIKITNWLLQNIKVKSMKQNHMHKKNRFHTTRHDQPTNVLRKWGSNSTSFGGYFIHLLSLEFYRNCTYGDTITM